MVQTEKKIAFLHRYPAESIQETNAAFPHLVAFAERSPYRYMQVLTFKTFNRLSSLQKFWKSLAWVFYAPMLVVGRGYDVIYCDDSFPFYPALVKMFSPRSRVIIRLGDFHLMYYVKGALYSFLHFFERVTWLMVDEIVAISDVMADKIEEEINRRPKVILDPVKVNNWTPKDAAEFGTVMFHGLLTKNKNVDVLLEAARRLPNVDFTILGDGPDFDRLMKAAPKNVFFKGWVPFKDVPTHIASCTIGVALRSDNPGNEYVVTSPFLQYGVMGKACLVTRRKVFGSYHWQFSGVDEMVEKLKALLVAPWEEGQRLRKRILKDHAAEKIAEEIWFLL